MAQQASAWLALPRRRANLGRMITLLLISLQVSTSVQWPAVAGDGRVAFENAGDLYIRVGDRVVRATSGPAIDRQPAWSPDGAWLYFTSDRAGNSDIWRVSTRDADIGTPERITTSAEPDFEPAVGPDGQVVFVRGAFEGTDLWVRSADGTEKKLTTSAGADRAPSVSREGVVAYVGTREGRRALRAIRIDGTQDRQVLAEANPEFPSWSPAGDRIAFTTAGRRAVLTTNREGTYTNTVLTRRGKPVWLPTGDSLLVSELPPDGAGYNGDPERFDREAERDAGFDGTLWRVAAPAPPDAGFSTVTIAVPASDSARFDYFDRAWKRIAQTYYARPAQSDARARWERMAADYRARVASAKTKSDLDQLLHEAIQKRPPLRAEASGRAGVSSAHHLATEAGLEILRKGGNVIDAAVAVSFALGVVEPDASGIGGYGQMLIYTPGMERPALLEFMSRVPEEAGLSNTALADPNLGTPALANVPGTVDAMWRAWQRYGSKKLKWAELLEPAIRLAEQGFVLDDAFPTTLRREQDEYLKYESTRALFFRNGRPLAEGDTLKNPDLAWTLKQIAQGGADAFYRGEIARRMVNDLRARGNAMNLRDLARYFADWREPVAGTYRGYSIFGSAPPVSGGATLVTQLNMLENFATPKQPTEDAATTHAMIEAWRLAPRSRMADPSLWPVDISASLSKDTARARWQCFFNPNRVARARDFNAPPDTTRAAGAGAGAARRCPTATADQGSSEPEQETGECDVSILDRHCRATGTTSFAVADAEGNMVAVTQTLGTWGGNFYVTPGLGFIYNDKLRSYGNQPDAFGARLPFARHGSSIAPTLVFRGTGADRKALLATGAAGNAWITAAVYQIVTGVIDQKLGPQQALELPRFLPSGGGGGGGGTEGQGDSVLQIEAGYSPAVIKRLEEIGHRFNFISLPGELRMGYGAAVMVDNGRVRAGGDPRRSGSGGSVR
jgi:gamma-glutamyltranspeptidase/glutathione hydrolase